MSIFHSSIIAFQKLFRDETGYFEYAHMLGETSISKVLHFSEPSDIRIFARRKDIIFRYVSHNLSQEKHDIIEKIFHQFSDQPFHVGYDAQSHRKKFYVSLYQQNSNEAKVSIEFLKTLFPHLSGYQLTQGYQRFDCFGFDILEGNIVPKIYEIIDTSYCPMLGDIHLSKEDVGYTGVMRTFSENERQKYFIRFAKPGDISILKSSGWMGEIDGIVRINPHWNIKYLCQEKERKEIYFTE
ncbi:hypothetical protein HOO68_03000 [Candidatus Gracilibacteria bacterium]|nr:hypothetical protein [Candidatus Gracilibacteria bacterium]